MKSSFGRSFSVFAGILLVALTVLGGAVIICGIALYSRTEETA